MSANGISALDFTYADVLFARLTHHQFFFRLHCCSAKYCRLQKFTIFPWILQHCYQAFRMEMFHLRSAEWLPILSQQFNKNKIVKIIKRVILKLS